MSGPNLPAIPLGHRLNALRGKMGKTATLLPVDGYSSGRYKELSTPAGPLLCMPNFGGFSFFRGGVA
jgi:hypothetical protein